MPFVQILVPVLVLGLVSLFFFRLAGHASGGDRERQRKARHLTGSARNAVLGSVGWNQGDGLASDFDCGMVSKEVGGKVVVARQARITEETVKAL